MAKTKNRHKKKGGQTLAYCESKKKKTTSPVDEHIHPKKGKTEKRKTSPFTNITNGLT